MSSFLTLVNPSKQIHFCLFSPKVNFHLEKKWNFWQWTKEVQEVDWFYLMKQSSSFTKSQTLECIIRCQIYCVVFFIYKKCLMILKICKDQWSVNVHIRIFLQSTFFCNRAQIVLQFQVNIFVAFSIKQLATVHQFYGQIL